MVNICTICVYFVINRYTDDQMSLRNIYINIPSTRVTQKEIISWVKDLEARGKVTGYYALREVDGGIVIDVFGDVDLEGESILYKFGFVSGHFKCNEEDIHSCNYPDKVASLDYTVF